MKLSTIASLFRVLVFCATVGNLHAVEIANSANDFDLTGTQGVNGWTYGYRDYTADGGGNNYGVNDFIAFNAANGWSWTGSAWDWGAGDPPWTIVSALGGHPNSSPNEHWSIRRWEAQVTEVTPLAITWKISNANAACSGGVGGSLHLNGTQIDSLVIAGGDTTAVPRTVYVNASPGDVIDLALTPENVDGTRGDTCDSSQISMVVDTDLPSSPTQQLLQPDGTPFFFATQPTFDYPNRLEIAENQALEQEDIVNFITNYQGNAVFRYTVYPNQGQNVGTLFQSTPSISKSGTLRLTPRANVHGWANMRFDVQDVTGGANSYSFIQQVTIQVNPVNFPPTFDGLGDQEVLENSGAKTVSGFVSNLALNDPEQSFVNFLVTNDNNALFSAQPDVHNNGNLVFTLAPDAYGTATVTVTATDSGADNNVSTPYQFTITVVEETPVHYVSAAGSNTFPYSSPDRAAHTIQDAIDAAEDGDIVRVADGTYTTGGRAATGENLPSRVMIDKDIHIVSENGSGSTVIVGSFGSGALAPLGPGAVRGVYLGGGATLEGFAVTGGATLTTLAPPLSDLYGGGIYVAGSGTVKDCLVDNNFAYLRGGGISTDDAGSATIEGCTISGNGVGAAPFGNTGGGFHVVNSVVTGCTVSNNVSPSANGLGGGGYASGTSTVESSTFTGNSSKDGGGLYLRHSSDPVVANCSFSGNVATQSGAGLHLSTSTSSAASTGTLLRCLFTSNQVTAGSGGGLFVDNLDPTISLSSFRGNSASTSGGGMACSALVAYLDHCIFSGNKADTGAGAYLFRGSLNNCTFSGNSATSNGGAITVNSQVSTLACDNSIFYGNEASGVTTSESSVASSNLGGFLSFQSCLVTNSGAPGAWAFGSSLVDLGGNLDADPQFINPIPPTSAPSAGGDYHLDANLSPAIDAGDTTLVLRDLDYDGEVRVRGAAVDLGPYEDDLSILWEGLTNDWTQGAAWLAGTVPADGEAVVFPAGAAGYLVDIPDARTVSSLTINGLRAYEFSGSGSLSLGGNLTVYGSGSHTIQNDLVLSQDNEWLLDTDCALLVSGSISETGGRMLTKTGVGTLTLGGVNSYTGGTHVDGGILNLTGTLGSGTMTIGSQGFLTGTGTIPGAMVVDGSVSPGDLPSGYVSTDEIVAGNTPSLGTLTTQGDVDFNGTYLCDLGGNVNDWIDVAGELDLTNATIDFNFLQGSIGRSHYIIASYGSLVGQFSEVLNAPDNTPQGYSIEYSFNDGTGNNHIALITGLPEVFTFDARVDNDFLNPANWTSSRGGIATPATMVGGSAYIVAADATLSGSSLLASDLTINSNITLTIASGGTMTMDGGSDLTIGGFGTLSVAGDLVMNSTGTNANQTRLSASNNPGQGLRIEVGGTFSRTGTGYSNIAGHVTNHGTFTEGADLVPGLATWGNIQMVNTGTATLRTQTNGDVDINNSGILTAHATLGTDPGRSGNIVNSGTFTTFASPLNIPNLSAVINTSTGVINGQGTFYYFINSGIFVLNGNAAIRNGASPSVNEASGIINQGTHQLSVLDYTHNGTWNSSGEIVVEANSALTIGTGGLLDNDGSWTLGGNNTINVGGTLDGTPALTIPAGSSLVLAGGDLAGTVIASGTGSTSANSQISGSLTILGGSLDVSTGVALSVANGGTLTLDGTYAVTVADGGLISVAGSLLMNSSGSTSAAPALLSGSSVANQGLRIESTGTFTRTGNGYSEISLHVHNHGTFSEAAGISATRSVWDNLDFINSLIGTAHIRGKASQASSSISINNAGTMTVHSDLSGGGNPRADTTNSGILNIVNTLVYGPDTSIVNAAGGVINGKGSFFALRNFGTINLTGTSQFYGGDAQLFVNEAGGGINQGAHKAVIRLLNNKGTWIGSGEIELEANGSIDLAAGSVLTNDGIWTPGGNNTITVGGAIGGTALLDLTAGNNLVLAGGNISGNVLSSATNSITAGSTISGSLTLASDLPLPAGSPLTVASSGTLNLASGDLPGSSGSLVVNGILATSGSRTIQGNVISNTPGSYVCDIDGTTHDQLIVGGDLDISQMTIAFSESGSGITEDVYVIATYGTLTGSQFANITNLPAEYIIDYAYDDGTGANHIAIRNTPSTYTFTAAVDNDFLNPANWTGGGTATPAYMLAIDTYNVAANATLDGAALLEGKLNVSSGTTLSVAAGGTLTLDGNYTVTIANAGLVSVSGSLIMNNSGGSATPALFTGPKVAGQGLRIEASGTFTRTGTGYGELSLYILNHGTFTATADMSSFRSFWDDVNFVNSATGTANIRGRLKKNTTGVSINNSGTMTIHQDLENGANPSGTTVNSGTLNIINTLVYGPGSSIINTSSGVINGKGAFFALTNHGTINLTGTTQFYGGDSLTCVNEVGGIINQGSHQAYIRVLNNKGIWNGTGEIQLQANRSINLATGSLLDNDGSWNLGGNNAITVGGTLDGTSTLALSATDSIVLAGGDIAGTVVANGSASTNADSRISGSLTIANNLSLQSGNTLTVATGGTLTLDDSNLFGQSANLLVNGTLAVAGNSSSLAPITLDHPNQPVLTIQTGSTLTTALSEVRVNSGILEINGRWDYADSLSQIRIPHPTTGTPAATTLTGSGTVNALNGLPIEVSGGFQPGPSGSIGDFSFIGNLVLAAGSTTEIEVGSLTAHDTFSATGAVSLLGNLSIDFSTKPLADRGTYTFLTSAASTSADPGIQAIPSALNSSRIFAFSSTTPTEFSITAPAYDIWAAASGLTPGLNDGFTDDPNGDGIPNIAHFAFDSDPLGYGVSEGKRRLGIFTDASGDHLTLTIPVRVGATFTGSPSTGATIDGIRYEIQGSGNLATWLEEITEITPAQSAGLPTLRDVNGDSQPDWEYRTFVLGDASLTGAFLRVKLE